MHQVDLGAHLERALGLAQQVAQPVERLLAQVVGESAHAALHQHAARHDVPRAVAADVADRGVALHALVFQALDHRVQPLDEERLRREHVAAPAHHPAVTAWSRERDVEGVRAGPQQARPSRHRARLHEAHDVQPDH